MVELVDHTGEMEMRVRSPTLAGVYAEALGGLAGELTEGVTGPRERRAVALSASGADTLLADLLNEAVFLAETEGFVADGLEVGRLEGGVLEGALLGRRDPGARPIVKAATYHGLRLEPDPAGGWSAAVLLDV